MDRENAFPAAALGSLAAAGGLGIVVPQEHGGTGGGLSTLAEACETVGSACASSGMVYLMHSVTAATIAGGGGANAGEYLRSLASGERVGTLAFSERGTGAHFYAPELAGGAPQRGCANLWAQELRDLRRARRHLSRARAERDR